MWINQKNAVSDEKQDSIQELQISFRSGGIGVSIVNNLYPNHGI